MSRLRLLQACNVGRIVGGTGACAWTVTRALPEFEHVVAFLSEMTPETRAAFAGVRIEQWPQCTRRAVDAVRADIVLLHNIGGRDSMSRAAVTLQYVHSAGVRAPADITVYCSRWLARQMGHTPEAVLHQGVPRPATGDESRAAERDRDTRLVVVRICTPIARKWPKSLIGFYQRLAARCPSVEWEFVGCPTELQTDLRAACRGPVRFVTAGWQARRRLWRWDALLYHHPNLTESFGRTIAESLRAGCIPIVDARGGFIEQVTPETGFLCAGEDQFIAALSALGDPELRQRMSAAAQQHGDRCFSIRAFRERLLRRFAEAGGGVLSHL
jgi:hypothetical protein